MSWLKPLEHKPYAPKVRKHGGGRPMRSITLNGVTYQSMTEAMEETGFSQRKIYQLIGEGYRLK